MLHPACTAAEAVIDLSSWILVEAARALVVLDRLEAPCCTGDEQRMERRDAEMESRRKEGHCSRLALAKKIVTAPEHNRRACCALIGCSQVVGILLKALREHPDFLRMEQERQVLGSLPNTILKDLKASGLLSALVWLHPNI